jgi:hypothetical protein
LSGQICGDGGMKRMDKMYLQKNGEDVWEEKRVREEEKE